MKGPKPRRFDASDVAAQSGPRTLPSLAPGGDTDLDRLTAVDLHSKVLELLLDVAERVDVSAGSAVVAQQLVAGIADILPGCAIGVCLIDASKEQVVEVHLPEEAPSQRGRDPTRLFPSFDHERIESLDSRGASLHLASRTPALISEHHDAAFVDRCVRLCRRLVASTSAFEQNTLQAGEHSRTRAKLIQTEKLASLGQIVAGVVHELNNPLTSIVAYSDYLRKRAETADSDPADVERLRRISEAAERILTFSRDLVAYARPTEDVPGAVDVHRVIDKAVIFCEHEFIIREVKVERAFMPAAPAVRGVAGQLTQVFVNLFTNAAQAMAQHGGRLRIATELVDGCLRIQVSDQGSGIPEDTRNKIFEPFFTTKADGEGTGLGLAIVRDIVEQHEGTLSLDATDQAGTTFSLVLPLAAVVPSSLPPGA